MCVTHVVLVTSLHLCVCIYWRNIRSDQKVDFEELRMGILSVLMMRISLAADCTLC